MRKKGRVRIVGDEVSVADLADQRLAGCVRGVDQSDKNFDPPLVSGIVLAEWGLVQFRSKGRRCRATHVVVIVHLHARHSP